MRATECENEPEPVPAAAESGQRWVNSGTGAGHVGGSAAVVVAVVAIGVHGCIMATRRGGCEVI